MKKRIILEQIEGQEECYLEIDRQDNGDLFIEMRGQDTRGDAYTVRAQLVSPNRGGSRNSDSYFTLLDFLKFLD
jgi:hypothetical protein